jgi:hypothetical protein
MKDLAASTRARLQAWAKARGIQFQYASLLKQAIEKPNAVFQLLP